MSTKYQKAMYKLDRWIRATIPHKITPGSDLVDIAIESLKAGMEWKSVAERLRPEYERMNWITDHRFRAAFRLIFKRKPPREIIPQQVFSTTIKPLETNNDGEGSGERSS